MDGVTIRANTNYNQNNKTNNQLTLKFTVMKTNSLKFTDYRIAPNGEQWEIVIRLDDECKNGHQDFSITGTSWEKGKPKIDKYFIQGGACGDTITELWPEFEIFNVLHLCDYKGIPMHCPANGYYHLKNGFNSQKKGSEFVAEYCKYYRLTESQFNAINKAESQTHFAVLLEQNGVFEAWEKQANEAIELLEKLTGNEFVIDSTKTNYHRPEQSKMFEELEKIEKGYYSEEAKKVREQEAKKAEFLKIEQEEKKVIEKIKLEYKIKKIMLKADKKAFENYIFYSHSGEIAFNWRNYGTELTDEEIKKVKSKIINILPSGVKFK